MRNIQDANRQKNSEVYVWNDVADKSKYNDKNKVLSFWRSFLLLNIECFCRKFKIQTWLQALGQYDCLEAVKNKTKPVGKVGRTE